MRSRPARSWWRPPTAAGEIELEAVLALLTPRTKLVAIAHVSNALGTVLPVKRLVAAAHARGVLVLLDGAQAVLHEPVDVQQLGCDFYAFSGHKVYGPTGIGVLYGREELLQAMPPWQGGGDMILTVSIERSTWNELPYKFEAGTPNIAGAVGLAAAIEYLETRRTPGRRSSRATADCPHGHGAQVRARHAAHRHAEAQGRAVLSFVLDGVHPHDLGTILDHRGRGHAHRAPLRHAGDGVLRHAGDGARFLRLLQHRSGRRTADRARCQGARGVQLMDLKDLYRHVILDHNRSPRNFGRLEPADAAADGHNPLCGDRLELTLRMDGDRLEDMRFEGQGCAISIASASLMTEAVKGKPRADIDRLQEQVHALLTQPGYQAPQDLGKLAALAGVHEFPARVKCASLCWHTLNAALDQAQQPVSTE